MKKPKAPRVPVLENAFELNLPKLMRSAKAMGASRLILDDGDVRTVVMLAQTRLAVFLGGRAWLVDIVPVQCLKCRVRPLLKCPRAHEGNFQSLYYRAGALACRHCHRLRYSSNLAASAVARNHLARAKTLKILGSKPGDVPSPRHGQWRKTYLRQLMIWGNNSVRHYSTVRDWLIEQTNLQ